VRDRQTDRLHDSKCRTSLPYEVKNVWLILFERLKISLGVFFRLECLEKIKTQFTVLILTRPAFQVCYQVIIDQVSVVVGVPWRVGMFVRCRWPARRRRQDWRVSVHTLPCHAPASTDHISSAHAEIRTTHSNNGETFSTVARHVSQCQPVASMHESYRLYIQVRRNAFLIRIHSISYPYSLTIPIPIRIHIPEQHHIHSPFPPDSRGKVGNGNSYSQCSSLLRTRWIERCKGL